MPSLPATARRRPCPGRCSPSPPTSARSWDPSPTALQAPPSVWWRSSCPASSWLSARFRSGVPFAAPRRPGRHARRPTRRWSACLRVALYDPVWTSAVLGPYDFALGLVGFVLLTIWAAPPWLVVGLTAAGGMLSCKLFSSCVLFRGCAKALCGLPDCGFSPVWVKPAERGASVVPNPGACHGRQAHALRAH